VPVSPDGIGDTSTTDGLGAADDPETVGLVGPSVEPDVQPAMNIAVAARHPPIRHSECRCLLISKSLRGRSVETIGCPGAERSGSVPASREWLLGWSLASVPLSSGPTGDVLRAGECSLGCGSSAGPLDEDGSVFADVELVVGGCVEGGAAGDSGVGLPGDGPGGGGGDGPGAGSAGAFFE
jgi:hypothetical protein